MTKLRWLQVVVGLIVLFGAGFVLFGDRRIKQWIEGGGPELVATASQPASGAELSSVSTNPWLITHRKLAAMAVMVLLGSDMVLPVPSSIVMTANGRLFGVYLGTLVSFIGSMLAWIGCYWLGRLLGWGAKKRDRPLDEHDWISRQLHRYGVLLLIATRPVPILAELTAAACGVARMGFWRFLMGSALGVIPMSLLYTYVGSRSDSLTDSFLAMFIATALPLGLYALIARPWQNRRQALNAEREMRNAE